MLFLAQIHRVYYQFYCFPRHKHIFVKSDIVFITWLNITDNTPIHYFTCLNRILIKKTEYAPMLSTDPFGQNVSGKWQ